MNSRLGELKKARKPASGGKDVEMGSVGKKGESFLADFFKDINGVRDDIRAIGEAVQQLGELSEAYRLATGSEASVSDELEGVVNRTNRRAGHAKTVLDKLKKENREAKDDDSVSNAEMRTRTNMYRTVMRAYVDVMRDYQAAQAEYKKSVKSKVARQVKIVKKDVTDEEVDEVMRSGSADIVFRGAILMPGDPLREVYTNVADRYRDVIKLEASIKELNQMFLDLALIVDQQSDLLDQIEFHVHEAAVYVDKGNEEIVKALDSQRKARNRKCCLMVVLIGVLFALLGGFGVFTGG